jgi:hypothetical protein
MTATIFFIALLHGLPVFAVGAVTNSIKTVTIAAVLVGIVGASFGGAEYTGYGLVAVVVGYLLTLPLLKHRAPDEQLTGVEPQDPMSSLDIKLIGELQMIWSSRQMQFQDPQDKATTFDKLCEMFALLSPPQRALLLTLTRGYSRYTHNSYMTLLISAFKNLNHQHLGDVDQVILAPLLNPGDDRLRQSKSGHQLLYIAEHVAVKEHPDFMGKKIVNLASPEAIPGHLSPDKKSLIVFLDDFIGSGDTAKSAVQHWQSKVGSLANILVVALVAMNHAVDRLARHNIEVVFAKLIYKGIEENSLILNKMAAYSIIDGIEASLNITAAQRRGYGSSEALISMIRTPDNTLPIYWCTQQRNGTSWPAPFPRQ